MNQDQAVTEQDILDVIDERDRAEEWADKLGEHSSGNDPWRNALEYAAAKDAEIQRLREQLTMLQSQNSEHLEVRREIGEILDDTLGGYEDGDDSGGANIARGVRLLAAQLAEVRAKTHDQTVALYEILRRFTDYEQTGPRIRTGWVNKAIVERWRGLAREWSRPAGDGSGDKPSEASAETWCEALAAIKAAFLPRINDVRTTLESDDEIAEFLAATALETVRYMHLPAPVESGVVTP